MLSHIACQSSKSSVFSILVTVSAGDDCLNVRVNRPKYRGISHTTSVVYQNTIGSCDKMVAWPLKQQIGTKIMKHMFPVQLFCAPALKWLLLKPSCLKVFNLVPPCANSFS